MTCRPVIVAAVTLAVACLCGCQHPLERIDREAERMIERRQTLTLGPDAPVDTARIPDRTQIVGPTPEIYNTRPATVNPTADELPAELATAGSSAEAALAQSLQTILEPEDAIAFDLEACLAYAVEHSREYRIEKEGLYLAAIDLLVQQHLWGPRFFNTVTAQIEGTPERGDYDQVARIINDFRVTQRLPYGGNVSVRAVADYVSYLQQRSTTVADDDAQSSGLFASIDLPLLRNAGQAAREDLIQTERNLIYATRRFERFRREFFVDIATDYFNLLRDQQGIANQQRQLANLEWLYRRFAAFADAGRQPFFQVQRVEQDVLFARNNLIALLENYAGELDAFKIRLGMPIEQRLRIVPVEVVVPLPALDAKQAVIAAQQYRLDLQTSRDQVADALRRVKVAENQTLPDLDLFGDVGVSTDRARRYGGARFDAGDGEYRAGVRLDVPLDREIEQLGVRAAQIDYERVQRLYGLRRDQVAQQVRQSIRRIEQAKFTLDLQNRNVQVAQLRIRGVLLRLRDLQPREFTDAQDALLRAETRRDAATRDLRVNVLNFLLDTDQLRVTADGKWQPPARLQPPDAPAQPRPMGELIQPEN
jgi:outer membrane protein TolC